MRLSGLFMSSLETSKNMRGERSQMVTLGVSDFRGTFLGPLLNGAPTIWASILGGGGGCPSSVNPHISNIALQVRSC